jgi:hypothetical protein
MRRTSPAYGSIALASLAAGPTFLVSTGLALAYLQLPRPVAVDPAQIAPLVLLLVPAIAIGFVLSFIPNLIGSSLLRFIGSAFPTVQARPVWIGAGALVGAAVAWSIGAFAGPAYAFGLIFTSACCAAICRLYPYWD